MLQGKHIRSAIIEQKIKKIIPESVQVTPRITNTIRSNKIN